MWVTVFKFVCGKSIIRICISLASSRVSSRLPSNKAPSLMLRIDTCELPHTNSYVVNQSYKFVFHLTSSLQPPNKKVRTFGKWCWWRSPNKAPSLMLQNDTYELPHTNLYLYHQSAYEFVLRNTKNYFPPEPKKLTQHHNCMVLQVHSSMYNQNPFPARTKNWHNSTTGKKVPPHAKRVYSFLCLSVCLSVRE
jgi:hypothetical protein